MCKYQLGLFLNLSLLKAVGLCSRGNNEECIESHCVSDVSGGCLWEWTPQGQHGVDLNQPQCVQQAVSDRCRLC